MASETNENWKNFLDTALNTTLKDVLKELGLSTIGNKAALKLRIQEAVKDYSDGDLQDLIPEDFVLGGSSSNGNDDNEVSESSEELDQELENLQNLIKKKEEILKLRKRLKELQLEEEEIRPRKGNYSFKDIEEAIPSFSGDDTYPVLRWIDQFEESARVFKLDDDSKFVYSKRLLTGTARLLMRAVTVRTWFDVKYINIRIFTLNFKS